LSLSFRLSFWNTACISHLFRSCYMLCRSHPPLFYHPNNIWYCVRCWVVVFTRHANIQSIHTTCSTFVAIVLLYHCTLGLVHVPFCFKAAQLVDLTQ
jgi:hypothetical protein